MSIPLSISSRYCCWQQKVVQAQAIRADGRIKMMIYILSENSRNFMLTWLEMAVDKQQTAAAIGFLLRVAAEHLLQPRELLQ